MGSMLNAETLLEGIAVQLSKLSQNKLISQEWLIDGIYNQKNWLHGAIWGALIKSVPDQYLALVESRFAGYPLNFKPDLSIANSEEEKISIIEYESTNSSDERIIVRDLKRYHDAILSYFDQKPAGDAPSEWALPRLWVIISTLPSTPVRNWPWHKYNLEKNAGPEHKNSLTRDMNPLKYYADSFNAAFNERFSQISRKVKIPDGFQLCWANIDQTHIRIQNLNGVKIANEQHNSWKIF